MSGLNATAAGTRPRFRSPAPAGPAPRAGTQSALGPRGVAPVVRPTAQDSRTRPQAAARRSLSEQPGFRPPTPTQPSLAKVPALSEDRNWPLAAAVDAPLLPLSPLFFSLLPPSSPLLPPEFPFTSGVTLDPLVP